MSMPKDPNMLLSVVNLTLRDYYADLDAMGDDMVGGKAEIEEKLQSIGYSYSKERNQFV